MILGGQRWLHDDLGIRYLAGVLTLGQINEIIARIAAYWGNPYTNLGEWKATPHGQGMRSRSHPGACSRRKKEEGSEWV